MCYSCVPVASLSAYVCGFCMFHMPSSSYSSVILRVRGLVVDQHEHHRLGVRRVHHVRSFHLVYVDVGVCFTCVFLSPLSLRVYVVIVCFTCLVVHTASPSCVRVPVVEQCEHHRRLGAHHHQHHVVGRGVFECTFVRAIAFAYLRMCRHTHTHTTPTPAQKHRSGTQ